VKPRLLFIGHSYHQQTESCRFFTDLLARRYDLDCLYDASWSGGRPLNLDALDLGAYAAVVLWQQIYYALHPAIQGHPNVILVPMFDCHAADPLGLGRLRQWPHFKFINFCRLLHEACVRCGLNSLSVQFFPNPDDFPCRREFSRRVGFFWPRRGELGWPIVERLIAGGGFREMLFHRAPDRGFRPSAPSRDLRHGCRVIVSDWFGTRQQLLAHLDRANIYFVSRLHEGIGMAFLEAMAMGMCVVAPDTPTMNEYIVHRINGLLYDPKRPEPLDFEGAAELAARARESIGAGYRDWLRTIPRLLDFLDADFDRAAGFDQGRATAMEPTGASDPRLSFESRDGAADASTVAAAAGEPNAWPALISSRSTGGLRSRGYRGTGSPTHPLITVAIVTRNAGRNLDVTLQSVFSQTYNKLELLVVDGASEDDTLARIRAHQDRIDYWVSEADQGPYFAMNKAARLAGGEWILFLNAGDWFASDDALARVVETTPAEADIIFGHHYYRHMDGTEVWHKANSFDWSWRRLREGRLNDGWVQGIPGHQATLTRTRLLQGFGYNAVRYRYAADHDFLFRMRAAGCRFHHANRTIAVYCAGGLSWRNAVACMEEQRDIAAQFGPGLAIERFYQPRMKYLRKQLEKGQLHYSRHWSDPRSCFQGAIRGFDRPAWLRWSGLPYREGRLFFVAGTSKGHVRLRVECDGHVLVDRLVTERPRLFGPKSVDLGSGSGVLNFLPVRPRVGSGADPYAAQSRKACRNEPAAPVIWVRNLTIANARSPFRLKSAIALIGARIEAGLMGCAGLPRRQAPLSISFLVKVYLKLSLSGLFSPGYYRRYYPEIGGRILGSGLLHYILEGAYERSNPNPWFDSGFYLDRNPDVAGSGINPLYHYVTHGAAEGRQPNPSGLALKGMAHCSCSDRTFK